MLHVTRRLTIFLVQYLQILLLATTTQTRSRLEVMPRLPRQVSSRAEALMSWGRGKGVGFFCGNEGK